MSPYPSGLVVQKWCWCMNIRLSLACSLSIKSLFPKFSKWCFKFYSFCKHSLRPDPQPEKVNKWLVLEQFVLCLPDDTQWVYKPLCHKPNILVKTIHLADDQMYSFSSPRQLACGPTHMRNPSDKVLKGLYTRPYGPKPDSRQDSGKGMRCTAGVYLP